jgi:hypothetical protein
MNVIGKKNVCTTAKLTSARPLVRSSRRWREGPRGTNRTNRTNLSLSIFHT